MKTCTSIMNIDGFASLFRSHWHYVCYLFLHATISGTSLFFTFDLSTTNSDVFTVRDITTIASSSSSPAIPVKIIPLRHPDSTSSDDPCHPSIPFHDFFSRWAAKIKSMTSMSYAKLAGLQPIYDSSFVPSVTHELVVQLVTHELERGVQLLCGQILLTRGKCAK
ncbi:hypothetical protein Bca52824_018670 [Brassica carinata]|uniref:Uncharacterized protein n=1 Tax=Brassica carinata TaxID=52824 RepID=A0A8X8AYV0_BRACI|nr:hypothetical protein Bca52824_018670 [Brassica carinata]